MVPLFRRLYAAGGSLSPEGETIEGKMGGMRRVLKAF
jgi:hypothetical protein